MTAPGLGGDPEADFDRLQALYDAIHGMLTPQQRETWASCVPPRDEPLVKTPSGGVVEFVDRKALFSAVSSAEGDMCLVYDLSLILHDFLEQRDPPDKERWGAYSHLSAELLTTGEKLKEHCDKLYRLAGAKA